MTSTSEVAQKAGGGAETAPSEALREAGQTLLSLLVEGAARAAADRISGLTDRLQDITDNGGQVLGSVLGGDGGQSLVGGAVGGAVKAGVGNLKDKVVGALGGDGGGGQGKKLKVTNIVESIDIALPLRTTYDLWSRYEDFPSFMKKVESVERPSDEKSTWKAQILWSHRNWEATVSEQVPDSHIVWRSKGQKGHVDGAVSFAELSPNLTRVLLVLEYWPQGMFEYTGNLWRAQGRRARLELKHFRRHAMTHVLLHQDEVEGWRGEIRDGEVVRTHEEALDAEQQAAEQQAAGEQAAGEQAAEEAPGGEPESEEDRAEEQPEDRAEEDEGEWDEGDQDYEEGDEDYQEEEEDEDQEAVQTPAGRSRRRR